MTGRTESWPLWPVPAAWRRIDVVSDLHLEATRPHTLAAFLAQVEDSARHADALLILGDLFEVWVGDDQHTPGAADAVDRVVQALRRASERIVIGVMHGNRDFLIGAAFLRAAGARQIADPTVLALDNGQRVLLTHGDALCLADTAYQAFRRQVRSDAWQQALLAQPLAQRLALAASMRAQSQDGKQGRPLSEMDIDRAEALAWLRAANAQVLLHGHTHQPGDEDWGDGLGRVVLSDWELDDHETARAQVLVIQRDGPTWRWQRRDRRPAATPAG